MRIYTRIEMDWDGNVLDSDSYEHTGPIAFCKRGAAKGEADQLIQQNQARANALSQLQQNMLSPMTGYLQGMVTNPSGFNPADLAAMRTQAIMNTANQFGSGLKQLKASLASRGLVGGATPTSGLAANDFGQYQAQGAQAMAGNLANINIQNALQAQQNRWNAANMLGNYAGVFNPNGFIGGASNAMGSRTGLETAPTIASDIGSFWGKLGAGAFKP